MTSTGEPPRQPRCYDRCNRMSDRGLCDWCDRRLASELAELPELWAMLRASLLPASGQGDGRGGGEPSLGVRVDVLSFLGAAGEPSATAGTLQPGTETDQTGPTPLAAVLADHAEHARVVFGGSPRVWTFTTARKWLVAWHDRICRQPWADDYAAEVHEVWQTARRLVGVTRLVHRLPAVCPECGLPALVRHDGADHVVCESCGLRYDEDQYRRLTLVLAAEMGETA